MIKPPYLRPGDKVGIIGPAKALKPADLIYALDVFKYFPYDSFVLFSLTKIYQLKGDLEKYAYFSYLYGIRQHSLEDLNNAYKVYLKLNKLIKAENVKERIIETEKELKKRKYI